MHIRLEQPADRTAVREVNEAAFGTSVEADLIDVLRDRGRLLISLIAEHEGAVVGHLALSPVSLAENAEANIGGLGPMAVAPEHQRRGIGSALVREGLARCESLGCDAVVVVGHAQYYPRFGFVPAAHHGFRCEYDVPDDVFMILELRRGALRGLAGLIRYDDAFSNV